MTIEPGVDARFGGEAWLTPLAQIVDESRIAHDATPECGRAEPRSPQIALDSREQMHGKPASSGLDQPVIDPVLFFKSYLSRIFPIGMDRSWSKAIRAPSSNG
jgi:hypothetical protein